jgi:periplasmic protein TonB
MLDRLLESGVQRRKSAWGGAMSVAVHVAIIALAVAGTATGTPGPTFTHRDTHIIAINPPTSAVEPGRVDRGGRGSSEVVSVPPVPTIDVPLPATFDPTLPGSVLVSTGSGADSTLLSEIGGTGHGTGLALGGTSIATDATVDVPVRALADRAPAYPEMLRAAGISGSVRVQFVVDTTGRAELSSVHVVESSHDLFTRAVLTSLRQARFTPGEVSGHRVRTLVERSYRFDIASTAR